MKTQRSIQAVIFLLALAAISLVVLKAGGGNLEPSAPPAPTGRSLEEIYNAVQSLQPQPQTNAFYAYLQIDGIPGESIDASHQGWIEVDSFSWGEHNAGSLAAPEMEDIVIVHSVDKASPQLYLACCQGTVIPEVTLEICRPTAEKQIYLQYILKNVMVSSVNGQTRRRGEAVVEDVLPLEEVSFNYQKISWTYTLADANSITTCWDLVENAPLCPLD